MLYDWLTFMMVGARDFFSPVQLATPGILLLLLMLCSVNASAILALFVAYFFVFLIVFNVVCDTGVVATLWSSNIFLIGASWFYGILGCFFLVMGWIFARQWYVLFKDDTRSFVPWSPRVPISWAIAGIFAMILAGILAIMGNVWPPTLHMVLQGVMTFASGRLFDSLGGIIIYEIVRNIGVLFVLLVIVLMWRGRMLESLRQRKSLIAIMLAAYFLAIGGALIHFHFMRISQ